MKNSKNKKRILTIMISAALVTGLMYAPVNPGDQVYASSKNKDKAGKRVMVKFKANGGKFVKQKYKTIIGIRVKKYQKKKWVKTGKKYGKLSKVKKSGYIFKGWYTGKKGGKKITANSKVKIKKKHDLYAHWIGRKYTVSFYANGGSLVKQKYKNYKGKNVNNYMSKNVVQVGGKYVRLAKASRTGYTFTGWYTKKVGGEKIAVSSKVNIKKNHTLYAHWTGNKYTVSFNANGGQFIKQKYTNYLGDIVENYMSKNVVQVGAKYAKLAKVKRAGYSFAGWYTGKTGGQKISVSSTVDITTVHTLYARWTANKYSVSFDSNGGYKVAGRSVIYNGKYGPLPTPKRPGCVFLGWYNKKGNRIYDGSIYSIVGNTMLTARWSEGSKATGSKYMGMLGKPFSSFSGLSKLGDAKFKGKTYVSYTDSEDMEYLFENNVCISIDGNLLLPGVPKSGYTLSEIESQYGKGKKTDELDGYKYYYEFQVSETYIVMEFVDGCVKSSADRQWASVSTYRDEFIMTVLELIYE